MALPNPTIAAEFARTKRLPSSLTFTRSSAATYTDNNGYVQYAANNTARFDHTPSDGTSNGLLIEESRTNLYTNSADFTASSWSKGNAVIISNCSKAPDGTFTADKFVETTTNGAHSVSQSISATSGTAYTQSVFVKAGERTQIVMGFDVGTAFSAYQYGKFDLVAVTATAFLGSPTMSITAYPNGWYRCSVTTTATGTATASTGIQLFDGTSNTYAGNGQNGSYFWGAQLEAGAFPTSYIPSVETFTSRASTATYFDSTDGLLKVTPTNLLTYSQDFTNAIWSKVNLQAFSSTGSLANIAIAPDGTQTASKLIESTAASTTHTINISLPTLTAGQYITSSIYVKAGERTYFEPVFWVDATHWIVPTVNLTTGTITATNTLNMPAGTYSTSIIDIGYGWKRIVTALTVPVTSSTGYIENRLHNGTSGSYTGDGVSGLYVWGAQVNLGQLQTYTPTTSAAITSGGSRTHYNGYSKLNNGVLLEAAATNLLTYSEQFDNAVWTKAQCSITTNQTTAPDGTLTADKLIDNTTNTQHTVYFTRTGSNETVTLSIFLKAAEYTKAQIQLSNTVSFNAGVNIDLLDGSINTLSAVNADYTGVMAYTVPYPNGWYRCVLTATKAAVNTTNTASIYLLNNSNTPTFAGTGTSGIYIWGAQLETGTSATSYIPTIASTVTRAADTGSSTSATRVAENCYINVGSWFNQAEGTLYTVANAGSGQYPMIASFNDGSTYNNQISLYRQSATAISTTNLTLDLWTNAAAQISGFNLVASSTSFALAWKTNDVALSYSGNTVLTDTSVTLPNNITKLEIGSRLSGLYNNGTIAKLYYFPKRLPNTDLQNLSGL